MEVPLVPKKSSNISPLPKQDFFLLACHTTGLSTTHSPIEREKGGILFVTLMYDLCLWPQLFEFLR